MRNMSRILLLSGVGLALLSASIAPIAIGSTPGDIDYFVIHAGEPDPAWAEIFLSAGATTITYGEAFPADSNEYELIIFRSYQAAQQAGAANALRDYVAMGGNTVVEAGVPLFLGVSNLGWFGPSATYGNAAGMATVAIDNPFGTNLLTGDTLWNQGAGGAAIAGWDSGTATQFAATAVQGKAFGLSSDPTGGRVAFLSGLATSYPGGDDPNLRALTIGLLAWLIGEVERCDGFDNDSDGEVDEGFLDTDGDGLADCVDADDDNDCYADDEEAAAGSDPKDPASIPTALGPVTLPHEVGPITGEHDPLGEANPSGQPLCIPASVA